MAASLDVIRPLLAKLEWAEKHIFHLQELRDGWKEGEEDRVRFEDNPNTGERSYYVVDIPPIPADFALITGDAIHNIRSTLDHLAHALVVVCEKSPGPFQHVYFPIAIDSDKYKTAKTRIERAREDPKNAIDGIEPYGGGAGEILWHLHALDIIDKHQLMITTVSTNLRYSSPPIQAAMIKNLFLGMGSDELGPSQDAHAFLVESKDVIFPLKAGNKLCTRAKAEVSEHMYFPFEIAFGEPQFVAGKSVIETLHRMADFVRYVIRDFDARGFLE